jgi:hypothetical protein
MAYSITISANVCTVQYNSTSEIQALQGLFDAGEQAERGESYNYVRNLYIIVIFSLDYSRHDTHYRPNGRNYCSLRNQ